MKTIMAKLLMALTLAGVSAGVAQAQGTGTPLPTCPMTYATFEFAVPHLDLDACPRDLARANAFCRAAVGHDQLHVFLFSQDGEQCLLASKSYKEDQYELKMK